LNLRLAEHGAAGRWREAAELALPGVVALAVGMRLAFGERWASDGPYYQAIGLKASREGHWWTLRESEILYLNKPPLGFWLHGLMAKVFGEGDWQARGAELMSFVLVSMLVGATTRRWAGRAAGIVAGVMMGCTLEWARWIPHFRLDMHHTLFMFASVACLMMATDGEKGERARRWKWTICAGVCVGLALMTKPFFAVIAPGMVAAWLVLTRHVRAGGVDRRSLAACGWAAGIGAAIAAPWHVAMWIEHGRTFVDVYVMTQSVSRAVGERFNPEPWWWYFGYWVQHQDGTAAWPTWPVLIVGLAGGVMTLRRWARLVRRGGESEPGERAWVGLGAMGLLWTLAWLGLMSAFADKRDYYMVVLYPGIAVLAGMGVARVVKDAGARVIQRLSLAALIGAAAMVGMGVLGRERVRREVPLREDVRVLGEWLRTHASGKEVYNGGLRYNDAALLYVASGIWPRTLVEKAPVRAELLPAGAWAVYDTEPPKNEKLPSRPQLDPADERMFEHGRFVVIRRRGGGAESLGPGSGSGGAPAPQPQPRAGSRE
jgi:4-amino-4-deoxy-L-arabinose transferase-like glycosyltransferase